MTKQKYPTAPGFRRNAPETSAQAAEAVKESAASIRAKVQVAITLQPMTANETAKVISAYWATDYETAQFERFRRSVSSRISELIAQGRLVDSGLRRKNESGVNAVVWRAASHKMVQAQLL